jgi:integrase
MCEQYAKFLLCSPHCIAKFRVYVGYPPRSLIARRRRGVSRQCISCKEVNPITVLFAATSRMLMWFANRVCAGIRDRGPHSLRHTLATEMVGKGATFKAVSDVLGHKSITTTLIYAKLDLEALKQVALPWPGGAR